MTGYFQLLEKCRFRLTYQENEIKVISFQNRRKRQRKQMYQNCCKKCGSSSLHTEVKGSNTGLYCDDCGAWVKWLGKDELRAFRNSKKNQVLVQMRDSTPEENQAISEYIKSISVPTGINIFDEKSIIQRLKEFVKFLDKTIGAEYDKLPLSTEDAIRKNSYCLALERDKRAIQNILKGHDYNYLEE